MQDRIYILTRMYAILNKNFAHWVAIDVDLNELYYDILRDIEKLDREGFNERMLEFVAAFENGHSGYSDTYLINKRPFMPVSFNYIEDEWIVVSSKLSHIKPGTRVVSVNSVPTEEYYQKRKKFISASSEVERRTTFGFQRIQYPTEYTITFDGHETVKVTRDLHVEYVESENSIVDKWMTDSTYYIRLPSFQKSEYEETAIERLTEVITSDNNTLDKVIIDVRGNQGGSTPINLIKLLMNQRFRWWNESTSLNFGYFDYLHQSIQKSLVEMNKDEDPVTYAEYEGYYDILDIFQRGSFMWYSKTYEPSEIKFDGIIVILIDRNCASAGEDFVVPFKNSGTAIIIGEPTFGSTGQPFMVTHKDIHFRASTKRAYMENGFSIEGRGIPPDINIPQTIQQYLQNEDPVLDRALEI